MLIRSDLDAPARLQCRLGAPDLYESAKWEDGRRLPPIREALRVAMTEECPAGKAAIS
jgi:hypothetical protein